MLVFVLCYFPCFCAHVETGHGWTPTFVTAFVKPAIAVAVEFLRDEINLAHRKAPDLEHLHSTFLLGFKHIYNAVHKKFVAVDPQLQKFTKEAEAIFFSTAANSSSIKPSELALQKHTDIVSLYLACYRIQPTFDELLKWCRRSFTSIYETSAKLKTIYRSLEKAAFRSDEYQWSAAVVLVSQLWQ